MGESIAEGTIVRWIKKVGDSVDRDEPLFEISTDKVDAEIPSPAAGVLTEIKAKEGETVAVNTVVGTIGQPGEAPSPEAAAPKAAAAKAAAPPPPAPQSQGDGQPASAGASAPASARQAPGGASAPASARQVDSELSKDDLRRQKSSPLVRRIARDNNIDISQIHGSGIGGRVTKDDILEYLGKPQAPGAASRRDAQAAVAESRAPSPESRTQTPESRAPSPESRPSAPGPVFRPGERVEIEPLSVMRKKIAEHMVLSRRTSAHVHSVFHVNFSTVERIRQQKKGEYEQLGAKLTYMAFIAKAVIDAIRRHPIVNASLDGDNIVYKKDVHLGIAVALDSGLIVPVVKNADEKNLLGLSRAIADVAERARAKQLKPDEVHGGTFTITNPGQFGAQFGMPIINQPQVAILGVGTIEKRPVVVDDAIAIRTMAYLTLGYDHRLVDGAVADQFMSDVKKTLENFDPNQV
jgi:2-oxoglutarate dehydrogenase E2 component (dihydrolipoamide succinyltransferase)